jgi:hypothetical protein
MILELPQLSSMINGFTSTVFRLELLDTYTSASDGGDVDRYLRGEPAPLRARRGPAAAARPRAALPHRPVPSL